MDAALRKVGFRVISGLDLNKAAFDAKLREFAAAIAGADAVAGRNYLVPVDAQLSTADALEFEMSSSRSCNASRNASPGTISYSLTLAATIRLPAIWRAMGTRSAEIGHGLARAGER